MKPRETGVKIVDVQAVPAKARKYYMKPRETGVKIIGVQAGRK
jgi:hypothetical protein